MPNEVCLTSRQQKFYNYVVNYYKSNGAFPTPAQAARDLNSAAPNINSLYGALLLKGVFSNGQPLTNTYRARHQSTPVQPLNLANFKFQPKTPVRPTVSAPRKPSKGQIATMLVKLLSEEKIDMDKIAQMFA